MTARRDRLSALALWEAGATGGEPARPPAERRAVESETVETVAAQSAAAGSSVIESGRPVSTPGPRFTARSADARAAILAAARARFAADGYEKATIRAIAADAGIDASMVIRYYGSKTELFEASATIDLPLPEQPALDPGELATEYARSFLRHWETGDTEVERLVLRAAVTRPEAVGRLQRIFDGQIRPRILAALAGDPDAELRAGLVLTQTLGLVLCRYLLRLEPLASVPATELESAVREAINAHLTQPLAPSPRGTPLTGAV